MQWKDSRRVIFCCIRKHRGKPDTKAKLLWVRKVRSTIERRDPLYAHTHQATQKGILIKLGLLKSGNLMNWWDDRTERPTVCSQLTDQFVIENDETNSYTECRIRIVVRIQIILAQGAWWSAKEAKAILKRCNKRQRQTFCDMENVYIFKTLRASVFMGKNNSDNWHSIKNTEDLTMKQIFDIFEKLITDQSDEIFGMSTIFGEHCSLKYLSLVGDQQVINLLHKKVYVFSDSVLCLKRMNENPQSNIAWEDRLTWFKSSLEYRALDRLDGEPMEFDWNIFPGFTTLQLSHKVQELEKFTGRIIFMSMFNDISWGSERQRKRMRVKCSTRLSHYAAGQWSFLGLGSEKNWYSISEDSPQGEFDKIAEIMMLTFA